MKNFLLFLFNRDIKVIKELSICEKKLFIYYIIGYIIFFSFFFYIEVIKVEKLIYYLTIYLIYLIYKILIELLLSHGINNKLKLKKVIWANNDIFNKILKILLFIQKWKNPILLLLLYIDKLYLKCWRYIIYKLKNYKFLKNLTYKQKLYIYIIQHLILNIITGPVKVVLGSFYYFLRRIIDIPFSFFFVIRSINIALSLLILSDVFNYSYNYLYNTYGYTNMYIFFYIFLIFISMFARFIGRDFKYLKIEYIKIFISTENIIDLRNHATFCGNLIFIITQLRKYCVENLLEKKYMDVLSIYLKKYVKEGFYKHWEYEKKTMWLKTLIIWEDIKNRPSLFLYGNLNFWVNIGAGPYLSGPNFITSLIYLKYKGEHLNLTFPENIQKIWDYLYEVDLLRFNLLLFILWDIDDYIGNKNRISYMLNKNLDIFHIGFDIEASIKSNNSYTKVFFEGIKRNKKDLKFYDVEDNMEFFDRLYLILGMVPYTEDPTKTIVWDNLLDNYDKSIDELIDCLNEFYQDKIQKEETWHRYKEMYSKDENYIPLIEYKIRDWIIIFLEEQRKEWELLKEKESIESRNWRLINEIENLLKKKCVI